MHVSISTLLNVEFEGKQCPRLIKFSKLWILKNWKVFELIATLTVTALMSDS